jgi:hypothetical protein
VNERRTKRSSGVYQSRILQGRYGDRVNDLEDGFQRARVHLDLGIRPPARDTPSDPVSCRLHPRKQGISAADARRCTPMQCAGLKTADYSLDLDAGLAEIEQQAQMQPGCRQIIDALGHVRFLQRANRFQFNHDGIVDQ